MKILHFSTRLGRSAGGLYHSVSGLAAAMADLGADVTVMGGREAQFEEERSVWGRLPLVTFPLGRARYGFAPAVVSEIARLKPDILHVHGLWSASTIYGRLAPKATQVVISPRGMLDPWILKRRPWIKRPHAALWERPSLGRAHVHALTDHEASAVAGFMPRLRERTFILPNGIDATAPKGGKERSGALYLGRLHEKKQVLKLIDAWDRHAKKLPLTIAGWGTPDEERLVAAACAKTKKVGFVGALYGERKSEALTSARFFILPSLSEGLPMAALEASSYGAIPVLTEACHLPDLVAEGRGLKMNEDFSNFHALVRQMETMSADEAQQREASAKAATQKFQWPNIARSMLDQYVRVRSGSSS
ncbi:glycosyltransferase [Devosia sp. BK]|uniref:glycosyltransferase n=1 Tax=Devosia sp. BK TaxID=2871706 RepID=UPI00293A8AAA|nr:glycosyltransferase [Devosia sp. BK]MDV3253207.1 glycosyltransferase [Devosia sp. BK]